MPLYYDKLQQHLDKSYRSSVLDKGRSDFIKSSRMRTKPPSKSNFRKKCDDIFDGIENQTEWLRQNKYLVNERNCSPYVLDRIDSLQSDLHMNLFRRLRLDPKRLFNDETFKIIYKVLTRYIGIFRDIMIFKSRNQTAMSPFLPYLFDTLISIETVAIMYLQMMQKKFLELIEEVMIHVNLFYTHGISRDERRYHSDEASDFLVKISLISTWLTTGISHLLFVLEIPFYDVPNIDKWQLQELSSIKARLNPSFQQKIDKRIYEIKCYVNLMSAAALELLTESDTDTDRPDGHDSDSDSDSDGGYPGRVVLPRGLRLQA